MISKGQSGTYAIMRELQLLYPHTAEAARLPRRHFPLSSGPLSYQLNGELFDMVYWIGRRQTDTNAQKGAVYDEGSRLLQILSDEQAASVIHAAAGTFKQRMVASVASVDYLRLRVAQRLSGELVEQVVTELIGDDQVDPPRNDTLSDLTGKQVGPLSAFFQAERNNALSRVHKGNRPATFENMDNLVDALTPGREPLNTIPRGGLRMQGGYALGDSEWQQYCVGLHQELSHLANTHPSQAKRVASHHAGETVAGFQRWLSEDVVAPKLNPANETERARSLGTVRRTLAGITTDVDAVRAFFGAAKGVQERVPASQEWRFQSDTQIKTEIQRQHDRLLNPRPNGGEGLSGGKKFMIALSFVAFTTLMWFLLGAFLSGLSQVLVAIGTGGLLSYVLYRMLRRMGKSIDVLRQEAEDQLFELYKSLLYAQAAAAVFEAVNEQRTGFVAGADTALATTTARIEELASVYGELQGRARARVNEASKPPLHSVAQVGTKIQLQSFERQQWVDQLAQSVRVTTVFGAQLDDLSLHIRTRPPVQPYSARVRQMATMIASRSKTGWLGAAPGQKELDAIDYTLDDMGTTVLRDHLPNDLPGALLMEAGNNPAHAAELLAELISILMHRDHQTGTPLPGVDRRMPSISSGVAASAFRMLVVPDQNVSASLNAATSHLHPATLAELQAFMAHTTGTPHMAASVGSSIVALSISTPADIMATREGSEARSAYYGTASAATQTHFLSQKSRNFQILPEAQIAASIELTETQYSPLHPSVTARLLGNDPDTGGPTLVELFYLLQVRGYLVEERDGPATNQRRRVVLQLPGMGPVTLFSDNVVPVINPGDPFGAGRRVINAYDAFADFLLFDGRPLDGADATPETNVHLPGGARVHLADWARLGPAGMSAMQQAILEVWYAPNSAEQVMTERDTMHRIAREDAGLMNGIDDQGNPLNVPNDWVRVAHCVIESGYSKRLSLVGSSVAVYQKQPS